jgi:hypothetical protein
LLDAVASEIEIKGVEVPLATLIAPEPDTAVTVPAPLTSEIESVLGVQTPEMDFSTCPAEGPVGEMP